MSLFSINRFSGAVGAEVIDVDPGRLVSDDSLARAILEALEECGVLVFRGLDLDPESQVAFCRQLGPIDDSNDGQHPVPGIYPLSLDKTKNRDASYLRATFGWHIDGCTPTGDECPQMATLLSAKVVAEHGGETEFASAYAAYDALADNEKARFAGLRVIHSVEASQRRVIPDPSPTLLAQWRSKSTHEQPLVWTHRTGRKSLVLGVSADYVVGMDPAEGRSLLDELLDRATAPGLVYRHKWSVGDTVIWNNRGVLHRATPYPVDSPRLMFRTTVLGDEPIE
ncbi:TauD/TfdA dioxygenase family protein [Mycobacterium sp. pW045]|uniref:TauD/TfdA dioxygenase family protein n=1 Tax=Mycobacterium sp. pW045 TaxID=3238984 RepID=UPI00351B38F1